MNGSGLQCGLQGLAVVFIVAGETKHCPSLESCVCGPLVLECLLPRHQSVAQTIGSVLKLHTPPWRGEGWRGEGVHLILQCLVKGSCFCVYTCKGL